MNVFSVRLPETKKGGGMKKLQLLLTIIIVMIFFFSGVLQKDRHQITMLMNLNCLLTPFQTLIPSDFGASIIGPATG